MEVLIADDGSFAFVFTKREKELGLAILDSFTPLNEEGKEEIAKFKSRIITAGDDGTLQ
jgi:hypothetical protein